MQTRSFRGSGEPAWVIASSNACERLGPDPRRALGPAAIRAASTGRTHDRTRPMLHQRKKLLSIRRRPHMTQNGLREHSRDLPIGVADRAMEVVSLAESRRSESCGTALPHHDPFIQQHVVLTTTSAGPQ